MARREAPMSVRRTIVEVSTDGLNVTRFCADLGVSTWLFYDLRRRYAAGGWEAVEPRSREAHRITIRTPVELENDIVELRMLLEDAVCVAGSDTNSFYIDYSQQHTPFLY